MGEPGDHMGHGRHNISLVELRLSEHGDVIETQTITHAYHTKFGPFKVLWQTRPCVIVITNSHFCKCCSIDLLYCWFV